MNIKLVLEKHKKWLDNKEGGERADLQGADLRRADLRVKTPPNDSGHSLYLLSILRKPARVASEIASTR